MRSSGSYPKLMFVHRIRNVFILFVILLAACNFPSSEPAQVNPTFVAVMTAAYQVNTPTVGAGGIRSTPTPFVQATSVFPTMIPPGGLPPLPTSLPSPTSTSSITQVPEIQETPGAGVSTPRGKIVFTCYVENVDQICMMNGDGSSINRLTNSGATDFYASLSPDGEEIVFSSHREGGAFQIYTMKTDGTDQIKITGDLEGSLYAPAFSPDGKHIAFTHESGSRPTIWVMDADGSHAHPLEYSGGSGLDPTWSPDGSQISFASRRSGSLQLYVINADGSDLRQVTQDIPGMGGRNSWSPDGRSLAFYAGPAGDRNIYLIDVDGSNLRQLTAGGDNLAPSFSPDGQWIAFTSYRTGNNEIYIMRPDGSEVTRLTDLRRPDWQPRWGP